MTDNEAEGYVNFLTWKNQIRQQWEQKLVGRKVILKEDMRFGRLTNPATISFPTILKRGTVGVIIRLLDNDESPFAVSFNGVPIEIAPLLSRLELIP
jgi:hypothetical protein